MFRLHTILVSFVVMLLIVLPVCGGNTNEVQAETKIYEYTMAISSDFTGPYAEAAQEYGDSRKLFGSWWNDTKGKEIGIKINFKTFDSRCDASVTASRWPGILSGDKPIVLLGHCGSDLAALQERLPKDKVPVFMSSAAYGFAWKPDQWYFQIRPTYPHEFAGFLNWALSNWKESRPIRVAIVSSEGHPSYKDQVTGIQKYIDTVLKPKDKAEFVGVEWVQMQPTDLSSEMKRLADKKPDYIYMGTNTAMVVAAMRGLQQMGKRIPLALSSHDGLTTVARAASLSDFEGSYDFYSMVTEADTSNDAYKIYSENKAKYGMPKMTWMVTNIQAAAQMILTLKAVERAVSAVGPDKLSGEAIYNAVYASPFSSKDTLGLLPILKYSKEAPFSLSAGVRITTVKEGKHMEVTKDWVPIPADVPKW